MLSFKIASLAILAAGVAAQNLPSCASNCVGSNYNGCSSFNVTCICSSSDWIAGLACCVSTACDSADQDATIQFADKICAGVGITTLPQTATCSSTASGSATVTALGSGSTTPASTSASTSTSSTASATPATKSGSANMNMAGGVGFGAVLAGLAVAL